MSNKRLQVSGDEETTTTEITFPGSGTIPAREQCLVGSVGLEPVKRMVEAEQILGLEIEERLRFEALMAELSSSFVRLPDDALGDAIEGAQRLLCEALLLDRSSLFQSCDDDARKLLLTHLYQRPDIDAPP